MKVVFRLYNVAINLVGIFNIICSNLQGIDFVLEVLTVIGLFIVLFIIVPFVCYLLFSFCILLIDVNIRYLERNVPGYRRGFCGLIVQDFVRGNRNAARRVRRIIVGLFRRRR